MTVINSWLEYDSPLSATTNRYHLIQDADGVFHDEATFRSRGWPT